MTQAPSPLRPRKLARMTPAVRSRARKPARSVSILSTPKTKIPAGVARSRLANRIANERTADRRYSDSADRRRWTARRQLAWRGYPERRYDRGAQRRTFRHSERCPYCGFSEARFQPDVQVALGQR